MITLKTDQLPDLPAEFKCPICGEPIVVDEIDEWVQNDDGTWQAAEYAVKINCTTEPDIDSDEFEDWWRCHWSMPYVDWLPLSVKVAEWINVRYRWNVE